MRTRVEWWRDRRRWVNRKMRFDFDGDCYTELITDLETGKVIERHEEKLSEKKARVAQ